MRSMANFYHSVSRRLWRSAFLLLLTVLCRGNTLLGAAEFDHLPAGCRVLRSQVLSADETAAVSRRLGAPIVRLSNNWLLLAGRRLRINIIEAPDAAAAKRLYHAIAALKSDPAFVLRRGNRLFEFVCRHPALATKAAWELGLRAKPSRVKYRLTVYLSPVKEADPIIANRLFNLCLTTNMRHPAPWQQRNITRLRSKISFGNRLDLRYIPGFMCHCTPAPVTRRLRGEESLLQCEFANLPQIMNIPYVKLEMVIPCDSTGRLATKRGSDRQLLAATRYWPAADREIVELARQITRGKESPQDKVAAILAWLTPGRHIRFGGVTGSRWGVKRVLRQRYGQCWDFSDCFVTLCRASGIPCRQVAGWLYGSGGHVWAEYLVPGKYWQQVDPTGGGVLACGIYHIPYFVSEDGNMAILYLAWPKIAFARR